MRQYNGYPELGRLRNVDGYPRPRLVQVWYMAQSGSPAFVTPNLKPTKGNLGIVFIDCLLTASSPGWTSIYATSDGCFCCSCISTQGDFYNILAHRIGNNESTYTFNGFSGLQGDIWYLEFSGANHFPVPADIIINQFAAVSGTTYSSAATSPGRTFFSFFRSKQTGSISATFVNTHGAQRFFGNANDPPASGQTWAQHSVRIDTGAIVGTPLQARWIYSAASAAAVVMQVF